MDQFSDRIKWLETIAYAVLGGVVGLRWSQEKLATHPTIAVTVGCLVVSLFNGYSAHDQVLQALQLGTPMLLAGVIARFTIICQFWFLAIGVALLAVRLLSCPSRRASQGAMFAGYLPWHYANSCAAEDPDFVKRSTGTSLCIRLGQVAIGSEPQPR